MGVEVRQTLEREHELVMSMRDIQQLTLRKLQELSLQTTLSKGECGLEDSSQEEVTGPPWDSLFSGVWAVCPGTSTGPPPCQKLLACRQLGPHVRAYLAPS